MKVVKKLKKDETVILVDLFEKRQGFEKSSCALMKEIGKFENFVIETLDVNAFESIETDKVPDIFNDRKFALIKKNGQVYYYDYKQDVLDVGEIGDKIFYFTQNDKTLHLIKCKVEFSEQEENLIKKYNL